MKLLLSLIAAFTVSSLAAQETDPASLLSQMSPSQKIAQLTGKTLFTMADDEALGIPGWLMSDGPHGVHREGYTSFPTGIATAALWDRKMLQQLGHAMGEEFWSAGQHVALAPCIDLCLDPRGGRTAESAGEDPYISGQIGKYIVKGIQSLPVMACLKHFEIEGKQAYRKNCDEIIAERDLMGFFGINFRTALQEGVPLSLMSSYNLVNGVQAAANRHLLTDILRERWGFPYTVISDWGGVKDGPASLIGGTDVCMGSVHYAQQLPKALTEGTITEQNLDTAVRRVLLTKYTMGLMDWMPGKPEASTLVDTESHRALCREATAKAVVLLRNEGKLLPLAPTTNIVVIGPNAMAENLNCFGSSETQPAYSVSLLDGLKNVAPAANISYVQGCAIDGEDTSGFATAEAAARAADIVVFAGGLDKTQEGESIIGVKVQDRESTALPAIQQQLISRLYAANPRLVVVLQSGGIVSLADCIDNIPVLVYSFYSGQEAGNGIADVLFGKCNPAGRLPMTMPVSDEQLPEWNDTYFTDDWGGGYRWFQRKNLTPQFPFGFGLSYTTFAYSRLRLEKSSLPAGSPVTLTVDITNTGDRDGEEVAQLYIGQESAPDWQPIRQLRGFERIAIPAGETRTISFHLTAEDFYEWSTDKNCYEVMPATYRLSVGPSSADLPLSAPLTLTENTPKPDLTITQFYTIPRYPRVGDDVTFAAYVKNQGNATSEPFMLLIGTEEEPMTALGLSSDELSYATTFHQTLQPGQGQLIFTTLGKWTPSTTGDFPITASISLTEEQEEWQTANNLSTYAVHVYGDEEQLVDGLPSVPTGRTLPSSPLSIYDLSGRRLTAPPTKGVFICNGKKYIR
ncbi:MAG: glycoside hydrolase family 3 C-terminal domain-containing protein [Bacteroidales bacterium]|nr:glycoside hydrolase family 3 C-terminal domain-containing protein [Bacteroidales bacterium]